MKAYDPFQKTRDARRKKAAGLLVLLALLCVAGLVLLSALLSDWQGGEERAPADAPTSAGAPRTGPESSSSAPWPSYTQPSRAPASPSPSAAEVDRGDPEAVAAAFVEEAASWDTTTDTNESAALARAAAEYGAPELVLPEAPVRPSAEWLEPARHAAVSVPVVEVSGETLHVDEEHLVFVPTGERVTPVVVAVSWGWSGVDPVEGTPWSQAEAGARAAAVSVVERDGQWVVIDFGWQPR